MAYPNRFRSDRLLDSDRAVNVARTIGELERVVCDRFGFVQNELFTEAIGEFDAAGRATAPLRLAGPGGGVGVRIRDTSSGTELLVSCSNDWLVVYRNDGEEDAPEWVVAAALDLLAGAWSGAASGVILHVAANQRIIAAGGHTLIAWDEVLVDVEEIVTEPTYNLPLASDGLYRLTLFGWGDHAVGADATYAIGPRDVFGTPVGLWTECGQWVAGQVQAFGSVGYVLVDGTQITVQVTGRVSTQLTLDRVEMIVERLR